MKNKNYYNILGVSRTESALGIRAAFRKLAKLHHPDVAGSEKTNEFQDISEAYCVLSNPEERRQYNKSLDTKKPKDDFQVESKEDDAPGRGSAAGFQLASVVDAYGEEDNPFDLFWHRSAHGFTESDSFIHFAQMPDVEVILSQEEAFRGGILSIPLVHPCPSCRGIQSKFFQICFSCGGRGMIDSGENINIRVPPNVEDSTVLDIPVSSHHPVRESFRVLIRIGNRPY